MALLETIDVVKRFGGLTAVNKISFSLEKGMIASIIGPNGAGKTTFFNSLTGIYTPEEGQIKFNGQSLIGLRPDQVSERGISRTFQNIRLFANMSALIGAYTAISGSYPEYINVSRDGDDVVVTIREAPTVHDGVYVCAHKPGPGACTAGGPTCNNYCNMAPEKGPMVDHPLPCTHTICGKDAKIRLPIAEWRAIVGGDAA